MLIIIYWKKSSLKKTRNTINENLARIEQEFLNQQIDIGLVEPRFDSIASSLRAWVKPKWILINKADSVYEKAYAYFPKTYGFEENTRGHRGQFILKFLFWTVKLTLTRN